jgi:putative MATE family efflux protein
MGGWDVSAEDITSGPTGRTLVVLALPLLAQNLVHVLNQLVDTFWLGRVHETAVAAVGLNFPLIATMFGVTAAGAVGTQILVAQRVGADDESGARRIVFNGAVLSFALGVALLGIVVLTGETLVRLLGAEGVVAPLSATYLLVFTAFFPLAAMSDTVERGFVGWGDTRATLYINLVMVGTNVVLDPFLVLGYGPFPELGVEGAALATGIGYTLGLLAAVALAVGIRDSLSFSMADARFSMADLRRLADIGAPVSGQRLAGQSARVAIVAVVATVGGAAGLAAYTVGARIATVAFVPASGFGGATQSMVGQNLGDDRPNRAHGTVRAGVAIAASVLGIAGLIQLLAPDFLATLFVPTLGPRGFDLTVDYLAILAYGYPAMGASAVLLAAFNGAARTRTSFVVDLLKYWGLRIPAAAAALPAAVIVIGDLTLGGLDWGIYAVFWAVTLSNVLAAVGLGVYYLWKREAMFRNAAVEAADGAAGSD